MFIMGNFPLMLRLLALTFILKFSKGLESHDGMFDNAQAVFTRANLNSKYSYKLGSATGETLQSRSTVLNTERFSPPKGKPTITETSLGNDTHITAVVTWTHYDSQTIFIITCDRVRKIHTRSFCIGESNVYRSTNFGKTFDLETNKFANRSQISIINTSPINRKMIFAQDQVNRILYISFDEGNTYTKSHLAFTPTFLSFHPNDVQYLLIKDAQNNIYLSNDTGENWKLMLHNVRNFFWTLQIVTNQSRIFFEMISLQNMKLPSKNYSLVYVAKEPFDQLPEIFDKNLGLIFPGSLFVQKDHIFIQRKTSAGNQRLFVLYKDSQDFEECELPTNELHVNFHFFEGRQHQVMVAALTNHGITNLYIADKSGKQFSLILEKVEALWKQDNAIIDVHTVKGVPGTLIANKVAAGTVISYNNGAMWKNLQPPAYDEEGKEIGCYPPDCVFRLSLYIQDKFVIGWSPITSSKFVPGVIIAQGAIINLSKNVKSYLYGFLSTDGGQSWKQALKGRHIYKLLDHGGMFAGVPITNPFLNQNINKVQYSCNKGQTWESIVLQNQVSRVVGVAAHPAAKSNILKIFGAEISEMKRVIWTIWHVNLTSVFDYKCSPNNYTTWVAGVQSGVFDSCILGQKYVYQRRKKNACCSNGIGFKRKENITICQCTMSDFECDFGFKRDSIGSFCIPTSFASLNPPINCPEGGQYIKSKGYIKIKGDFCQGGIESELMPVTKQCPVQAPDGISLSLQKYSIALGKTAEIALHQKSGFLGTKYNWDYGDGFEEYNLTISEATRYHKYEKVGTYVITVLASNNAGSFTAKTVMRIIERVSEVYLHVTKPVVAMEGATYTAELITHGSTVADRHGFVHFAWIFEPIKTPVLSLNSSVEHVYDKPGTYEVEVRVFNAISVVSATVSVTVFGDVRVLELQFSSTLDLLNKGTKEWNDFFKAIVHEYLIKTFKIRRDMVVIDVSKTLPTIVTLSLVQNKIPEGNTNEMGLKTTEAPKAPVQSIDTVMHEIIARVKNRKISFYLFGQEVRVLKVTVIRDKKKVPVKIPIQHGLTAQVKRDLYIGVSIGGFISLLCVVCGVAYWRKRRRLQNEDKYLVMQD